MSDESNEIMPTMDHNPEELVEVFHKPPSPPPAPGEFGYREPRVPVNENTAQARNLCTIFDEMRTCHETSNYSYLPGLIEEAQHRANRMESRLGTLHDFEYWYKESKRLRAECEELGL